jgi:hypothetical protein
MGRHRFDDEHKPHRWGGPVLTHTRRAPGTNRRARSDEQTTPLPLPDPQAPADDTTPEKR